MVVALCLERAWYASGSSSSCKNRRSNEGPFVDGKEEGIKKKGSHDLPSVIQQHQQRRRRNKKKQRPFFSFAITTTNNVHVFQCSSVKKGEERRGKKEEGK
jgi:hypothetical protein